MDSSDNETDIGSNAQTYTPVAADIGHRIRVDVSFKDDAGSSEGPLGSAVTTAVVSGTLSDDATLSALALQESSDGTPISLSPSFSSTVTDYTASVAHGVDQITILATINHVSANYEIQDSGGTALTDADGVANDFQVDLDVGPNTIDVEVTAEDSSTETYSLVVTRAVSERTLVSNVFQLFSDTIVLSTSEMAQGFETGDNTGGYDLDSIEVDFNGVPSSSDASSLTVALWSANNADAPDSPLATLTNPSNLSSQSGTQVKTFTAPANTSLDAETLYFVHLSFTGTSTVQLDRTLSDNEDSGAASGWSISDSRLFRARGSSSAWISSNLKARIRVNGEAKTVTLSTDASLSDIELQDASDDSGLALNELFVSTTTAYTADVVNDVEQITVLPTFGDDGATVAYLDADDAELADADGIKDDHQVDLNLGENTIKVKVTAEDGDSEQTYILTVTRAAATPTNPLLVSNLGQAHNLAAVIGSTDGMTQNFVHAQKFSVPSGASYNLSSVTINVVALGAQGLEVTIRDGSGIDPGTTLYTLDEPADLATGDMTFPARAGATLEAGEDYFIAIASKNSAGVNSTISLTNSNAQDPESLTGWSIANVRKVIASGGIWGDSAAAIRIQVRGNAIPASTDASLSDIELEDASDDSMIELNENFVSSTTAYTAGVVNDVEQITVLPTFGDDGATVAYLDADDATLTDADGVKDDFQVDLNLGENTIKVKVTAEDGDSEQTYTLTVTRAAAPAPVLVSNLTESEDASAVIGGIGPDVMAQKFLVGSGSDFNLSSLTIDLDSFGAGVNVAIYEEDSVDSSIPASTALYTLMAPSALDAGNRTFVAQGNATLSENTSYFVYITASAQRSITVSNSDSETGLTGWSIGDERRSRISSTWSTVSSVVRMRLNGTALPVSTDATLSNIELQDASDDSGLALNENFVSSTTAYTANVVNDVEQITVLPSKNHAGATVEYLDVDDATLSDADGTKDDLQVDLNEGENTIKVKLTAQDGVSEETYTLVVTRAEEPALVSNLAETPAVSLALATANRLAQKFTVGTGSDFTLLSVTLYSITAGDGASVAIHDENAGGTNPLNAPLYSLTAPNMPPAGNRVFTAPADASLIEGESYFVVVTTSDLSSVGVVDSNAQSGLPGWGIADTLRYYTGVSWISNAEPLRMRLKGSAKEASTDATLSALALQDASDDSGLALNESFVSSTTAYTANVVNDVEQITVLPSKNHAGATVQYLDVDDAELSDADGTEDDHQVDLNEGENTIKVKVTAQDDVSEETYTLVVTRAAAGAGVCDRTAQVRDAIVSRISGVDDCADVTAAQLATMTGELDLSGSSISALQAGDFAGLDVLTGLDLSDNDMTELPSGIFADLILRSLQLNENALEELPEEIFDGLTVLTVLDLSDNALTGLPAEIFDGLAALTDLWVDDNALEELPEEVFDGLMVLEQLRLTGNALEDLPPGIFDGLTALTLLTLGDNALSGLPPGIFDDLAALVTLAAGGSNPWDFTLTAEDARVYSGDTAEVTVTLSHVLGYDLELAVGIDADSTAVAGTDYTTPDTTLTVMAGQTSAALSIDILSGATSGRTLLIDFTGGPLIYPDGTRSTETSTEVSPTLTIATTEARGKPEISGPIQVGKTLTATTDKITDPDGLTGVSYDYQWLRAGADISGATASSYTLTAGDLNEKISLRVNFDDDESNPEEVTSDPTYEVAPAAVSNCDADTKWCATLTVGHLIEPGEGVVATGFEARSGRTAFGSVSLATFTHLGVDYAVTAFFGGGGTSHALILATTPNLPSDGAGLTAHLQTYGVELDLPLADIEIDAGGYWSFDGTLLASRTRGDTLSDVPLIRAQYSSDGVIQEPPAIGTEVAVRLSYANREAQGRPEISGVTQVGKELSASTGDITDADGNTEADADTAGHEYTYQWLRVDGMTETEIMGETSQTYTLVAADANKKVKVNVSFTDDGGSPEGPLTSDETETVLPAAENCATDRSDSDWCTTLTVGSLVSGSGDQFYGYSSTSPYGDLDDTTINYGGETIRVSSLFYSDRLSVNDSVNTYLDKFAPRDSVFNFGGTTFTASSSSELSVAGRYTWSRPSGFAWLDGQEVTVSVKLGNFAASGRPGVSGTAQVGEELTATTSGLSDNDGNSKAEDGDTGYDYSYQWVRVDSDGTSNATDITSETSKTYTLVAADEGKKIKVKVSFKDDRDNNEGPITSNAYPTGSGTIVPASSNNPPEFTGGMDQTRDLAETVGNATVATAANVGAAVVATDDDSGDTLAYSLGGMDSGKFTFDTSSGQIKTKVGERYDFEDAQSYSVTVTVNDGTVDVSAAVTINIVNNSAESPLSPAAPDVSASTLSATSIDVDWTAPENTGRPMIDSYDVQYRKDGVTAWTDGPQDQTGTDASISGLEEETTYEVQVRATNADGDSAWSATGSGSTEALPALSFDNNNVSVDEDVAAGSVTLTLVLTPASSGTVTVNYETTSVTAVAGQDFSAVAGTLTFAATETTKTITVPILNDDIWEPLERFRVTLTSESGATLPATPYAHVTVESEEAAPVASISDVSVAEADGTMRLTLELSRLSGLATVYQVASSNVSGTATSDVDYTNFVTGAVRSITVPAGQMSATLDIAILDDDLDEDDETIIVHWTINSTSGRGQATPNQIIFTGTISNDDSAGVSVSKPMLTVTEGDTTGDTYSVVLTSEPTANVEVGVGGTTGTDVSVSPSSLTFTAMNWDTAQTVTVTAADDSDAVNDSATLTHTATSTDTDYSGISINSVEVTVADDDSSSVVTIAAVSSSITYDAGSGAAFTLSRTGATTAALTVSVNLTQDKPYLGTADLARTVTFAIGDATRNLTISGSDLQLPDNEPVENGTLTATVAAGTGYSVGSPASADVDIVPFMTVRLDEASYTVSEAVGTLSVTVTARTGDGASQPTAIQRVSVSTASDTALFNQDFTTVNETLNFAAGDFSLVGTAWQAEKTVDVAILDDEFEEPDEVFNFQLNRSPGLDTRVLLVHSDGTTAGSLPRISPVTIEANDTVVVSPTLSFGSSSYAVAEGGVGAIVRVLLTPAASVDVTIALTTTLQGGATAADYSGVPSSVQFDAGETEKTFTVTALSDSVDDDGESLLLGFGPLPTGVNAGTPSTATVALEEDQDVSTWWVSFDQDTYTATEGGAGAEVKLSLRLNRPPWVPVLEKALTVPLFRPEPLGGATGADYSGIPESVTFQPGSTTTSFTVTATDDSVDDDGESVLLQFAGILPGGLDVGRGAFNATVHLKDNDGPKEVTASFGALAYTAEEGGAEATVRVRLDSVPGSTVTIPLTVTHEGASSSDYSGVPASVTFGPSIRVKSFMVTAEDDSLDDDFESVTIGFGELPSRVSAGDPAETVVNLTDNDGGQDMLTVNMDVYKSSTVLREVPEGGSYRLHLSLDRKPDHAVTIPLEVGYTGGATAADVTGVPVNVTFDKGTRTVSLSVRPVDDTEVDPGEGFVVSFGTMPAGVEVGEWSGGPERVALARFLIIDNDADPGLTISNASAREWTSQRPCLNFWVTLDRKVDYEVRVDYRTVNGTAVAGQDYIAESGTLVFWPAERSKSKRLCAEVINDSHDEGVEEMTMVLSNPVGARLVDGTATGRISNTGKMPGAWLTRFGRAGADHVIEAVGDRWEGRPQASHLTIGGRAANDVFDWSRLRTAFEGGNDAAARADLSDESAWARMDRLRAQGLADGNPARGNPAGGNLSGGGVAGAHTIGGGNPGSLVGSPPPVLGGSGRVAGDGPGRAGGSGGAARSALIRALGLPDTRGLTDLRDVLMGSSFFYSGSLHENGRAPVPGWLGQWSAWGRTAASRFSGADGKLSIDGEVATGMLGFDSRWNDRWLAGVVLSHSEGLGAYKHPSAAGGAVASTMTGVHPYARYELNKRTSFWGVLGYGVGGLSLTPAQSDPALETDLTNAMAAFGGRTALSVRTGRAGRFVLAVRSDARLTDTASDSIEGLVGAAGQTGRLRVMLEGSGSMPLAIGGVLKPKLEAGLRYDTGDAETGAGLEVGGGLGYTAGSLSVQVSARGLVAHEDVEYEEWGFSGSVAYTPGRDGRGLSMKLGSAWGSTQSGVQSLWNRQDASGLAGTAPFDAAQRFQAQLGYGIEGRRKAALWRPFIAAQAADGGGREIRLGLKLTSGPNVGAGLEFGRRESGRGVPEHAVQLRGALRW